MKSAEEIAHLLDERTNHGRSRQATLNTIAALYHGRVTVPLPELDAEEEPAVANFILQGIEQKAMRIASVQPELRVHARSSQGSDGRRAARNRRTAWMAFDQANGTHRKMLTRARWMAAYSTAPVFVIPDFVMDTHSWRALNGPKYLLVDPRGFYPAQDPTDPTNPVKDDAIMHSKHKLGWLRRNHPSAAASIANVNVSDDAWVDWIVYVDHEQIHTLVSRQIEYGEQTHVPHPQAVRGVGDRVTVTVAFMENRTGHPLVVAPGGVSLTMEPIGRFDQVVGSYRRMAELDALSRIALQKSIFSEAWITSNPGERGRLVKAPRPLEGVPGEVEGGRIDFRQLDPQFAARIGIGDLERNIRLTGMLPAEFGGELPTNARTARQGGRLMSNVIDFDIREVQQLLEESKQIENDIAARVDREYFGGFTKTVEVDTGARTVELSYDPAKLWTSTKSRVSYALAGSDAEGTVIGAGQRMGMETLSRRSFMESDPMVRDVEEETDRIASENVRRAFLARVQMEAQDPNSPWTTDDFARYAELVEADRYDVIEAYSVVQREAQERQAAMAAAAPDQMTPEMIDAQPGVSGEGLPSVQGPTEGQSNLTSLLGRLRLAQATVPGEIPA